MYFRRGEHHKIWRILLLHFLFSFAVFLCSLSLWIKLVSFCILFFKFLCFLLVLIHTHTHHILFQQFGIQANWVLPRRGNDSFNVNSEIVIGNPCRAIRLFTHTASLKPFRPRLFRMIALIKFCKL